MGCELAGSWLTPVRDGSREMLEKGITMMTEKQTRRGFLRTAAGAGAVASSLLILPKNVLGGAAEKAASGKINLAGIGLGGRGYGLLKQLAGGHNVVALCEVDDRNAAAAQKEWPAAKRHRDFRRMFDVQQDIDAVVIATPDHQHFAMAMRALKAGKHVYCEKPLTHTVQEARALAAAARESKVATQMGNQGNAGEGVRIIQEWLEDGAIGAVREVQAWTNKPECPQGINRPADRPPVPAGLDWDLWLGPAPERPYHPAYLPFVWRAWWAFGSCALGDMACHVLNTPWRALKLGLPVSVEAYQNRCTDETGPLSSIIYFEFPARGSNPPVRLTWHDGGMMPPRPLEMPDDDYRLGDNEGCLFLGETGKIMCSCYGDNPRLLPIEKMKQYGLGRKRIARSPGHGEEWFAAIKGGPQAGSHFEHAAVLTEVVQLGNVAIRTSARVLAERKQNGYPVKILWDAKNGKVTNIPEANQFLQTEYRPGWV